MIRRITSFGAFQQFNAFNRFTVLFELYKPYINYSWSQTLTVGGNQQIKDTGTAGLNLQQFFGQGCWFNGVDNYLNNVGQTGIRNNTGSFMLSVSNITSNPNLKVFGGINTHRAWIGHRNGYLLVGIGDVSSIIVCPLESVMQVVLNYDNFNYEVYVNNQLKKTGTYTVAITENRPIEIGGLSSSFYISAVIKDVYLFKKALSQIEIEKYTNNHNQFFMDSLEDSSCVLAMPMCEKDGFVRNYKSYSEGSNLAGAYANTDYGTFGTQGTLTKDKDIYTQTVTVVGTSNTFPRCDFVSSGIRYANKAYVYEFDYEVLSGTCMLTGFFHGGIFGAQVLTGKGRVCVVSISTQDRSSNNIYFDGRNLFSVRYWNFSVKELRAIYPISNYLSTCRTNAQRLPYGLQTSGFKRDTNGLILSKSSFLEADGVGYGNTGWIPENGQEFTIEWIYSNPINGVDVVNEGIGIEINNNADFYLRQLRATGTINVKFGANSIGIPSVTKMIYLAVTVTSGNFTVYVNSINIGTSSNTYNRTLNTLNRTFFLGGVNRGSIEKIMTKESKLFKVHQKALSQEEVTQNFNKYQAQGLLSESGLLFPDNALVDESGNFILDENNNFIIVE